MLLRSRWVAIASKRQVITFVFLLLQAPTVCGDEPTPLLDGKATDRYGDSLPPGATARLGTVRFRRGRDAAFAPDGKTIAALWYGFIYIWDVETGKERQRLELQEPGNSYALAYSPDGKQLARSIDGGYKIEVWHLATGKVAHKFVNAKGGYRVPRTHSLVFSGDGKKLYTSNDQAAYVWDLITGKQLTTFPHPASDQEKETSTVAFTADASLLATTSSGHSIRVWAVSTGKMLHEFTSTNRRFNAAAFSPTGDLLAVGGDEKTVELWNMKTGEKSQMLRGHGNRITSIAFSPDGSLLAVAVNPNSSASGDQEILLWNLAAEKIVMTISAPGVQRVLFSPDGKIIAWESCRESINFLNATTGKELHSFAAHKGPINAVAYSADGKLIATPSEDGDIRLWNPATGESIRTLKGHKDSVLAVAFSAGWKAAGLGMRDYSAAIWDVATGQQKWLLEEHGDDVTSVAFSPDGKSVATGSRNDQTIIWSTENGKRLRILHEENSIDPAVAYFPDGKFLAAGGGMSVRIWDLRAGKITKEFLTKRKNHNSVAISPDGKMLASGGAETIVWDVETEKELIKLTGFSNFIGGIAFSHDGKYFASASDGLLGGEKHNVHIWETRTGMEVDAVRFPLQRYTGLAFSPDGKRLATSSVHAEVLIWNIEKK